MAILRGGKRIGGFDIRIGLPRDRSLDDVQSDPRLRQKAGGNPETTMGRFQSYVNEGEGFARKARYYVEFQLPKGLDTIDNDEADGFSSNTQNRAVHLANVKRVQAFCSAISMPDRDVQTKEIRHNGPARKFVYDFKSADITATFYADKFLRERSYFELWQQSAFSTKTFNYNYYDNYVAPINIFQLGNYASRQERDDTTYAIQLFDCYPKTIGPVSYSYDTNTVQTFDVTFTFRYWINYFIDKAGSVEVGQSEFNSPTVTREGGIFGGLISKLPPELRRAGRDVLNELRKKVPTGGITGGRVFPPFKIPPLNI